MNRARRPPLLHPLVPVFDRAVDSLSAALSPDTARHYHGTARHFLSYLGTAYPELNRLHQLRREPHVLGWMSCLRSQAPPLATASYINRLIALRCIFNELAWAEQLSALAPLIRREDIPRLPQRLPRPLTADQDQLLQQEFLRRNDLGGNAFLLIRHTGMRIGECIDLSFDCLRSPAPHQWAIHVPLGKLKTERLVPVDSFVCELVQLPILMKLLGHTSPEMTISYLDVALTDLQREFELARSKPRHLAPQPQTSPPRLRAGLDGVIDSLLAAQHVLEMFRRALPEGTSRHCLNRLSNRLTKIVTETRKLRTP